MKTSNTVLTRAVVVLCVAAATTVAQDYTQLSKATTADQYQSTFSSIGLQKSLDGFNQDFTGLVKSLQSY